MKRGSIKHGAYTTLQLGYLRPNDLCSHSADTDTRPLHRWRRIDSIRAAWFSAGPGYIAAQVVTGLDGQVLVSRRSLRAGDGP